MIIRFSKMHGLGNDFVVCDLVTQRLLLNDAQVKRIADRHFGIGCDQLLLLEPPRQANHDFFYRIFNQDGTEVSQCGNGARCLARFIRDNELSDKDKLIVGTLKGTLELQFDNNDVIVNMGAPDFNPKSSGFKAPYQAATYQIKIDELSVTASVVNLQNPHCIITTSHIDTVEIERIGTALNQHPRFEHGVNVSFMQIISQHEIYLRTFERGVGETYSCGSAACAAVAAGILRDLLHSDVTVKLQVGELTVAQASPKDDIFLKGPTVTTFYGKFKV